VPDVHLIDFFERSAAQHPDRLCLHDSFESGFTYRETLELSWRAGRAMLAEGLPAPMGVTILSQNTPEVMVAIIGAARAGMPRILLNLRDSAPTVAAVLKHNDCGLVIYHPSQRSMVEALKPIMPEVRRWICLERSEPGGDPLWADWIGAHPAQPPKVERRPADVILRVNTGGTTGLPKSVMHSRRTMHLIVFNWMACFPAPTPPVHLVMGPVTHAAGVIALNILATGGTNVLMPAPELKRIPGLIERFRVTDFFLPPTAIYMLLAEPGVREHDYASLRHFFYTAAPMSADRLRVAIEVFGPVMAQIYGQTEMISPSTVLSPRDHVEAIASGKLHRLVSAGRPAPIADIAIMDDEGRLLPDGERGEIVQRGDGRMVGYYKDPAATEAVSGFGWHHTGDVGYRDSDGFYYVVDRKKDMIITGGFNVYPAEVEQVVMRDPAVSDCAVIGVPDDKWGEMVTAVLELKAGAALDPEALLARCRAELGGVRAPKRVEIVAVLPRSPVGKVLKRVIRDQYWKNRERQI
jgi:acyl-CoA synthetase (AMP-forming)/AMP-acid ligase II